MLAPILSYEDLGLIQGSGWLFQGLDLYIGERDRLALIGRNGAGKTTLLKLIAGSVEPDKGLRSIVPGTHVDRQRVVEGKSVSVRGDSGGCQLREKNKNK